MAPTAQKTDLRELFSGLTVTPDSEPLPEISRQRESLPNPFTAPLQASVEHGTPYSIHVPADAVSRAVALINAAARKTNLGVRVVVNVQRDDKGQIIKGADGKAVPIVDSKGEHKGTVLIRFQGKAERKKAAAPRLFSIVDDPNNKGQKALRQRSDKAIIATGTHDEMRALLKQKNAEAKNAATQESNS